MLPPLRQSRVWAKYISSNHDGSWMSRDLISCWIFCIFLRYILCYGRHLVVNCVDNSDLGNRILVVYRVFKENKLLLLDSGPYRASRDWMVLGPNSKDTTGSTAIWSLTDTAISDIISQTVENSASGNNSVPDWGQHAATVLSWK